MSRSAAAVARLSGPGELAAALPVLCGFVPHESVVLVCLEGPRRVGLTMRLDLPPEDAQEAVAAELAARVRCAGADRAYVAVVTDRPGLPFPRLVEALRSEVEVVDALLVRDGRWWSYLCTDPDCCPADGTPLPASSTALQQVRAEAALQGRAVLPSRADLVASLGPPALPALRAVAVAQTAERLGEERGQQGRSRVRGRLRDGLRAAVRDAAVREPDDEAAAELALALHDVQLRDELLTAALTSEEEVYALLLCLARRTPAPWDAAVCACLAWVAYSRGDGAVASVALDRALATDPDHGLAVLLRRALDGQVPPRHLRAVAARAAGAVRGRRT